LAIPFSRILQDVIVAAGEKGCLRNETVTKASIRWKIGCSFEYAREMMLFGADLGQLECAPETFGSFPMAFEPLL
jgi:hypothetical protein